MLEHNSYTVVLPYGAHPAAGMSNYAYNLQRQLVKATNDATEPRPQLCSICVDLRRINCTHVSAERCASLRRTSKRRRASLDHKDDEEDSALESYDFYSCGDVFLRGTYDELITDANKPRFRGEERGDRRSTDLCPLCWTEACWGDRGAVRGVRLTVRAPLRLRRARLLRQGKLAKKGKKNGEDEAPPANEEDTSIKRRMRGESALKKWRVRGLMRGKVEVAVDRELRIRRVDKLYKRDDDI